MFFLDYQMVSLKKKQEIIYNFHLWFLNKGKLVFIQGVNVSRMLSGPDWQVYTVITS